MAQLKAARAKRIKRVSPKNKPKPVTLTSPNAARKRRLSISSVSTISSISSIEDISDLDAAEASSDDENEGDPAKVAPSYGTRLRGGKTGSKIRSAPSAQGRKLSYDDGYEGQQSSDDDSDTSDYAAVDEIPDDDDDEELQVEKLEEQLIVASEDEHLKSESIISLSDAGEDWGGLDTFQNNNLFSTETFLDESQLYSNMDNFGETDLTSEAVETPMPRHVHFVEDNSDSSSDQSLSSSDDELPSDFLQQDSLDPTLRQMIENDQPDYDYDGKIKDRVDDVFGDLDSSHPANIYHAESDAMSDESSGYETDEGETTDEDLPPPAKIAQPRTIMRRDSTSKPADDESPNRRSAPHRRRGPILGTFIADPSKPVALVDNTGKHLVIIPAYASSRHDWLESATNSICGTANNSPRATMMHVVDESDTDAVTSPNGMKTGPMLSSGANLMMTALGNDATPGGQAMGPPEAFYPSRTFPGDSSYEDDDIDDDEAMLNVDDFIDFGDGSSDEETDKGFDDDLTTSPMATSSVQGVSTPTPSRVGNDSAERFLNHLDRGIVTAFRRHHNRYQTLIRLPHHREFLPNSPSQAASVFRHARYSDPRTPTRKNKTKNRKGGETVRRKLLSAHRHGPLAF